MIRTHESKNNTAGSWCNGYCLLFCVGETNAGPSHHLEVLIKEPTAPTISWELSAKVLIILLNVDSHAATFSLSPFCFFSLHFVIQLPILNSWFNALVSKNFLQLLKELMGFLVTVKHWCLERAVRIETAEFNFRVLLFSFDCFLMMQFSLTCLRLLAYIYCAASSYHLLWPTLAHKLNYIFFRSWLEA